MLRKNETNYCALLAFLQFCDNEFSKKEVQEEFKIWLTKKQQSFNKGAKK